jgi:hypothetical protein
VRADQADRHGRAGRQVRRSRQSGSSEEADMQAGRQGKTGRPEGQNRQEGWKGVHSFRQAGQISEMGHGGTIRAGQVGISGQSRQAGRQCSVGQAGRSQ